MILLKQSTAVSVKYGPFVDSTDGDTAETTLTIQKADVRLSKNSGNMVAVSADQGAADAGAPHDELGKYDGSFDATDTNTLGSLVATIKKTGALIWEKEYTVVPADVHDAFIAGTGPGIRTVLIALAGNSAANQAAATILERSARSIVRFTVGGGSSPTLIVTSSIDPVPTSVDQFKNRTAVFDKDTITTSLRGQQAGISASTTGATAQLTVETMTATAASGDTGTIV